MIVVSDTSPISGLLRIGQLELLPALFQQIIIPRHVMEELLVLETDFGYDLTVLKNAVWLDVRTVHDTVLVKTFLKHLHQGESEALTLAKELNATLLLDDSEARRVAEAEGVPTIGLLGVLLQAKQAALITLIRPLMDDLKYKAEFWISDGLYRHVLKLSGESV